MTLVPQACAGMLGVLAAMLMPDGCHADGPWQLKPALSQALDDPCQALYLRLYQRVGPWFRVASLEYSEVPDMAAAVGQLATAGFATTLDAADPDSLHTLAEASVPEPHMHACELLTWAAAHAAFAG